MSKSFDWGLFWFISVLVFVFWPWGFALVDITAWMLTGQQLTAIPWREARGTAMMLWPIVWVVVILLGCTIFG